MAAEVPNTSFDIYRLLDSIPEVNVSMDVSDLLVGQETEVEIWFCTKHWSIK